MLRHAIAGFQLILLRFMICIFFQEATIHSYQVEKSTSNLYGLGLGIIKTV